MIWARCTCNIVHKLGKLRADIAAAAREAKHHLHFPWQHSILDVTVGITRDNSPRLEPFEELHQKTRKAIKAGLL